jgi:hypothetical protein
MIARERASGFSSRQGTRLTGNTPPANARSIVHGVWPPLTAMMKRPRDVTAARAASAITAAALRATTLSSDKLRFSRDDLRFRRPP